MRAISHVLTMITVVIYLTLAGCGFESGPARYAVNGKVTFGGVPIKSGVIQFVPDYNAGNSGKQSFMEIKEGTYSIPANLGIIGGDYVISVTAHDGVPYVDAEGTTRNEGKPLFQEYVVKKKLEAKSLTYDVDVPKELANPAGE